MSDLFEVREDGPITILSLKPTDDLIATDLENHTTLNGIKSPRPT